MSTLVLIARELVFFHGYSDKVLCIPYIYMIVLIVKGGFLITVIVKAREGLITTTRQVLFHLRLISPLLFQQPLQILDMHTVQYSTQNHILLK